MEKKGWRIFPISEGLKPRKKPLHVNPSSRFLKLLILSTSEKWSHFLFLHVPQTWVRVVMDFLSPNTHVKFSCWFNPSRLTFYGFPPKVSRHSSIESCQKGCDSEAFKASYFSQGSRTLPFKNLILYNRPELPFLLMIMMMMAKRRSELWLCFLKSESEWVELPPAPFKYVLFIVISWKGKELCWLLLLLG